jgi:RNA polymerase sigma-70 factor, ECF subfamily
MAVPKAPAVAASIAWADQPAIEMDEHQFGSLYDATARPVLAYLAGVTGRIDVAEDLVQETFCRFLAEAPALPDQNDARRYLFRIATNLLRDRWRRREDTPWAEPPEPGFLPATDTQIDVRTAMQALKPRERELLWLAYVEGMSHIEIADATGLNPMSVRLLLFRTRRKAAALLKPEKESK